MTFIEQKIHEFEQRPAACSAHEQQRRMAMFQHLAAINKFEGMTPSVLDTRLFELLAAGKISKQEYLDLCLADARSEAE